MPVSATELTQERLWDAKGDRAGAISQLVAFGSFHGLNKFYHWAGPDSFISHISLFYSAMAAYNIVSAHLKIKRYEEEMREYEE